MERGPCAFKSRPDSVAEWLDALHLSRYKDAFDLWLRNATQGGAEVEILPLLAGLTNAQLMEMGVQTVGHRKRLLIAASYINASPSSVIADTAAIQAGEPSNRECPPSPSCTGYPPSTVASSSQAEETEATEVRTIEQVVEREDAEVEPPPGAPQPDGETPLSLRIRVALQRNVRPIAAVCLLLSIVFVYINPPTVAYAAIFVAAPTTLIASQQAENAMVMRGVLLTGPCFFLLATCRNGVQIVAAPGVGPVVRTLGSAAMLAYAAWQNFPLFRKLDERTLWASCRRISGFWGLVLLPVTNSIIYVCCDDGDGAGVYLPGESSLFTALVVNAFVVAISLAITEGNRERLHRLWLVPLSVLTAKYLRAHIESPREVDDEGAVARSVNQALRGADPQKGATHWRRSDRSQSEDDGASSVASTSVSNADSSFNRAALASGPATGVSHIWNSPVLPSRAAVPHQNLMNVELDDETRELLGEPSNWTPPPTDGWKRRLKAE